MDNLLLFKTSFSTRTARESIELVVTNKGLVYWAAGFCYVRILQDFCDCSPRMHSCFIYMKEENSGYPKLISVITKSSINQDCIVFRQPRFL